MRDVEQVVVERIAGFLSCHYLSALPNAPITPLLIPLNAPRPYIIRLFSTKSQNRSVSKIATEETTILCSYNQIQHRLNCTNSTHHARVRNSRRHQGRERFSFPERSCEYILSWFLDKETFDRGSCSHVRCCVLFCWIQYYKGLTKSFLGNNAMSMAHMVEPPPLGAGECYPAGFQCKRVSYNPSYVYGDCAICCSGEGEIKYRSQWSESWNCKWIGGDSN